MIKARPKWGGNRRYVGPMTGTRYGRISSLKTVLLHAEDYAAHKHKFDRVDTPSRRSGVQQFTGWLEDNGYYERPAPPVEFDPTKRGDIGRVIELYSSGDVEPLKIAFVAGTINRLALLQRFVQSCRNAVPRGVPYEIVIADNGSDDGTPEWLADQDDITLVQMGEPVGAIAAFTAAFASVSDDVDYVLYGNDDIELIGDGLTRALVHLETHPRCGVVAFQHDRRQSGVFGHEEAPARLADGTKTRAVYANTGLVRKWLGDHVDWWGGTTSLDNNWTYGGDNWLSASVWEAGYTVDVLDGVRAKEHMPEDETRAYGATQHPADAARYHAAFPDGHLIRTDPQIANPQTERLRVLYLEHFDIQMPWSRTTKQALRHALGRTGAVFAVDFIQMSRNHTRDAGQEIARLIDIWQPHLIMTQLQRATPHTVKTFERVRSVCDAVLVDFIGDYWPEKHLCEHMIDTLQMFDLALTVNAAMIPLWEAHNINAAYWPQASEEQLDEAADVTAHDVLFQGTAYSDFRVQLGKLLKRLPYDVGVYGHGWQKAGFEPDGFTHYRWDESNALNAAAKIVISTNEFTPLYRPDAQAYGYVGNRLWEVLYSGGFLLQQEVDGLDELTGLVAGKHYAEFDTLDDLPVAIDYWMERPEERAAIAAAGRRYVRRWHSWDRRVEKVLREYLPEVHDGRG